MSLLNVRYKVPLLRSMMDHLAESPSIDAGLGLRGLVLLGGICAIAGCGVQAPAGTGGADTVLVSLINVTSSEITAVMSGVLNDSVDTVTETVAPVDSVDVPFVCIDELIVGDPLNSEAPGVTIAYSDGVQEIDPFSVSGPGLFTCGDVIEVIISGNDPDSFAVDVFVFTPP